MSERLGGHDLDLRLEETFLELGIDLGLKDSILLLLQPLKEGDEVHREHYEHSIRVGILAKQIAESMGLDGRALFLAGIFHDLGKQEIRTELLGKTEPWTDDDLQEIQGHVMAGYRLLKGKFDFSAEVMVRHHTFQPNSYPKELPSSLHEYSEETRELILEYGGILAIADVYDALHRKNSKFGERQSLTQPEIRGYMLTHFSDRKELIEGLYDSGILASETTS